MRRVRLRQHTPAHSAGLGDACGCPSSQFNFTEDKTLNLGCLATSLALRVLQIQMILSPMKFHANNQLPYMLLTKYL